MYESLVYPKLQRASGGFTEIAAGVYWIRMPMPYRLDHVNVWAIDDGDGWALVDTGLCTSESAAVFHELAEKPPFSKPLTRVFATHWHEDHVGLAGWLTRKHDVPLWMSRAEYLLCRTLLSDGGRDVPSSATRFYQEAGWSEAAVDAYRIRFSKMRSLFYALPDSYHRLRDGMKLRIGEHEWEVVTGYGHSPEHSCLYCPALKLLISGDQVLPRISTNVSVYPMEPAANPMADWLSSIEAIRQRVPDDVLVAPAHHDPFYGLHVRIEDLIGGQRKALDKLNQLLDQPRRVVDVFGALFKSSITESQPEQLAMATGEAIANLNYLIGAGVASREVRDGVAWYFQSELLTEGEVYEK